MRQHTFSVPTVGAAFSFLEREGPSILGRVGSMLYVGHRSDTHPWWRETFAPLVGAHWLAVIDIIRENADSARPFVDEVYVGDVRDRAAVPDGFGLVFWDEGPEHMPRDEALETIPALRSRHSRVLVSCPWGFQRQGTDPTDPEFHHWGPTEDDLRSIGMEARGFGTMFPGGHGNLIGWI